MTNVKILGATPGLWVITVHGDIVLNGVYHAWLPIAGFVSPNVEFLSTSPYYTITSPGTTIGAICCGAYNSFNQSLYIKSSCGSICWIFMVVTGDARLLFGKGFFDEEGHYTEALRLFSYTGREVASVMTSDVIGFLHPSKESEARSSELAETLCFGFINRTSYVTGNSEPFLFRITKGDLRG